MKNTKHILILDSIPSMSGSKVATQNILASLTKDKLKLTVLTHDESAWQAPEQQTQSIHEPPFLTQKQHGAGYLLRHFVLFLNILWVRIKFGKIDLSVGASDPSNDLAIYLYQFLFNNQVMQLIHEPITPSKTAGHCLREADAIFYIGSATDSINQALKLISSSLKQLKREGVVIKPFINGLPSTNWPSAVTDYQRPHILWAASLLKWKGLDTLVSALKRFSLVHRPESHICYIRPKQMKLEISQAPIKMPNVNWHESPENLDEIRQQTNVFISTSDREPFGLSILEAMAAGHCVFIPKDGAYWDHQLIEDEHCIKYLPGSAQDLNLQLRAVIKHPERIQKLGLAAQKIAKNYQAEKLYYNIVQFIEVG